MPCVVKECGRRGAIGGDRADFLMAAWVTRSSYGSMIEPYIGVNVADCQMDQSVGWAKRSVPTIYPQSSPEGWARCALPTLRFAPSYFSTARSHYPRTSGFYSPPAPRQR